MANRSMVMASCLIEEAFEAIDVDVDVYDLSSWEVIDASDDDEDSFSYDEDFNEDVDDGDDDHDERKDLVPFGSPSSDVSMEHESKDLVPIGSPSSDISMESLLEQIDHHRQFNNDDVVEDEFHGEDCDEDDEEYDDDDEEEEYDLDDELVPKWVNDRFERQRMRKLGKRAYPKMNKSKRLPYFYNMPGCVRGKHGLGLKHNLVW